LDLSDDKLVRFGAFRALSRADPADMGFDRSFTVQNEVDGEGITNRDDLIRNVSATGSPEIGPLTSWNIDLGYEWYPNDDSIFAVSTYYKQFKGGFENIVQNETYIVDGQEITRPVGGLQQVGEDTSSLFGVEITGSHRFSYLPGYLSGLGVKASYNHASSDFEFEDSLYGNIFERDLAGNSVQTNVGIVAPGGLPGLSENVFSGTAYYQIGKLDTSIIYKYRDNYFQPATSDGTRLRYIGSVGVWEARAAYKINDNFRVSVEAINIFDAEKEQFQWVQDNQYEVNSYGPRIFFGLRGRF
jgi:TonB-dependent receptor